MVTINIDGKAYSVEPGENLLKTCIKLGFDIPYFCYHPALGSVGSCRLCAVKRFRDASDTKGRIIMSCMEPVTDGMFISLSDNEVKDFRSSVIEGLMTNHPHDCPVCDEGGECHLQDMVVMTGHNYRRYEFKKRTYKNQDLGPYIHHEMNRCIQCYRCVRYYKDYAGGKDFGVFGSHNHLYFGRLEDGQLESEFSGNLVEVCPTGVFTDKTLKKHYTRKWDLTNAPSICTHCAVGCNTIVGERYGQIRRTLNRYNDEVNGYFLCDKGRFGYEFVNSTLRIKKPMFNNIEITAGEAISKATNAIISKKVVGIGSAGASLESNYALQKVVGKENFYAGIPSKEFSLIKEIISVYQSNTTHVASLKDIEKAEAVIILGEDILKTAPRLALSVRQSVKNKPFSIAKKLGIPDWHNAAVKTALGTEKGPLFIATSEKTKIDDIATATFRNNSEGILRLAKSILSFAQNNELPARTTQEEKHLAELIVKSVSLCKSVVIITGTQAENKELIQAAGNIASALKTEERTTCLYCVVPESNSLGLGIIANKSLDNALETIENGNTETLIVLENNIYRNTDKQKVDSALAKCKNVIVLDHTSSEISSIANLVLSSGTFAEAEGTVVNAEGRMQRYFSALPSNENIRQSWKWLAEIDKVIKKTHTTQHFDDLCNEIANEYPLLGKIKEVAPNADYRLSDMRIPRQTQRFSGRTSILADVTVHEPKPVQDENSPLIFSMEGSKSTPPAELTSFYWSPGWNSVQASNKYLKELNNAMKGKDPGVRIFE